MTQSVEQHRPLDYGILAPEACDAELRQRVLRALKPGVDGADIQLDRAAQADVRRYIHQLEDALLRHHWGELPEGHIAELLRCATGLDIAGRNGEILAMTSEDA